MKSKLIFIFTALLFLAHPSNNFALAPWHAALPEQKFDSVLAKLQIRDPFYLVIIFSDIAALLEKAGDHPAAIKALDEAVETAMKITRLGVLDADFDKAILLSYLANKLAKAGEKEKATQVFVNAIEAANRLKLPFFGFRNFDNPLITPSEMRSGALSFIALDLQETGITLSIPLDINLLHLPLAAKEIKPDKRKHLLLLPGLENEFGPVILEDEILLSIPIMINDTGLLMQDGPVREHPILNYHPRRMIAFTSGENLCIQAWRSTSHGRENNPNEINFDRVIKFSNRLSSEEDRASLFYVTFNMFVIGHVFKNWTSLELQAVLGWFKAISEEPFSREELSSDLPGKVFDRFFRLWIGFCGLVDSRELIKNCKNKLSPKKPGWLDSLRQSRLARIFGFSPEGTALLNSSL